MLRKLILGASLFALLGLLAPLALADVTGTIRGAAVDQTGAGVPGASVQVVEVDTNYTRTLTTDSTGFFVIVDLPAGKYTLTVKKSGFRTYSQAGIVLQVGQSYVVKAQLELGAVTQTVEVAAAPIQADTTTMQLGNEISGDQLNSLPVLNRDWIQLQQTLPGTVAGSDRFGADNGDNFSTNGNRTQANNYLINGSDSNDLPLNSPLDIPSPDAIQEVKIVTNTLNPEYGRNSGATLNAITKSGTNTFHGSAFEYYRDTFMNARNFFSSIVPPFHQNQFGGTLGGPAIKNKLFGFFSYQGRRAFRGIAQNTPVFSAAQTAGDWGLGAFAASTKSSPFALFGDNTSPCPVSSGTPCPAGTAYSALFKSGAIPSADFTSAVNPSGALAAKLMKQFVPAPNVTNATGSFFQFSETLTEPPNQYIGRADYNLSSSDSIYGYVFVEKEADSDSIPFGGGSGFGGDLPGFGALQKSKIYQYTVNESHIFNPNTLNEFRIAYNRFNFNTVLPATPVTPASLGFTGIKPQGTPSVPFMGVLGFFDLGFSEDGPQPRVDDTGELIDNFSINRGNHAYKMGVDIRRQHVFNPFFFINNGAYGYNGVGAFSTGQPGADFELGIPDSYVQSSGGIINSRTWEYYSYVQDQWRLRPNFTLTYGIGWQIDTPLNQLFNHGVAINEFRPGQQSTVFPSAPRGLVFPGDAGITSSGYHTHYNNFGPRVGFAWSPRNNWSVRAGWGIYYNNSEEELLLQDLLAAPFSLVSIGVGAAGGSPNFINPFQDIKNPSVTAPNLFPFTPFKVCNASCFASFEPFANFNGTDPNFNTPYNMNYNLTVQHQISRTMVGTLSYVGSQGRRLENVSALNPFDPKVCLAAPACSSNPTFEAFTPGVGTVADASIFGSLSYFGTFGVSKYDALQATWETTGWHGLSFRSAYSWSHSRDNGSSFENAGGTTIPSNFHLTYGDSAFDARQRLALSFIYNIPGILQSSAFGKRVFGGWGTSGVATFQKGFPIQLTETDLASLQCSNITILYGCWDRPNAVAPVKFENPRTSKGNLWFDKASFAPETLGTLGNAGRNFFHGPGINDWNLSFFKDTTITESTKLQLRIDAFNVFNHAQFAAPGQSGVSGSGNGAANNVNTPLFGSVLATQVPARVLQLSAHFTF